MEGRQMAREAEIGGGSRWRIFGWGCAVLVLLTPFVAMQVTSEVNWTQGDFIFAALLIGLVGLGFELTVRASRSHAYRGGVAAALVASFLIIWVNGAVGMIGDEGNPYNLLFLGVIAVALMGAALARFRAAGMARAMVIAAIAQSAVALCGMPADLRGGILSACFAGLWLLSATLFRKAAREV
jgi:hypothetical protein